MPGCAPQRILTIMRNPPRGSGSAPWWELLPGYDVVIVGAGVVGLSTAYHILRRDPRKRVLVVDKAPGLGGGDSGKSAAASRAFFYSRTNLALAHSSIEFYRRVQEGGFDLGMLFVGYLFVFGKRGYAEVSGALAEVRRRGLEYREYEPEDLAKLLGLRTSFAGDEEAELMGLEEPFRGVYVPVAGVMRPENLLSYYAQEVRRMGGEIAFGTEVRGFLVEPLRPVGVPGEPFPWQEAEVRGVVTDRGEVRAGKVVVAAGAWTHKLLDPLGIDCHSRPKKRQVFVVAADTPQLEGLLFSRGFNEYGVAPFTILPRGVYVRPEPSERRFWVGMSDELGRPIRLEEDPLPEERFYLYGVYPVLHKYLPQFRDARPCAMWAGHYDISPDGLPV
ncbi:TPA: FAD-binding oxidoreductase, partial [Candidatus Micrarchaeota archaeon]|nr:FAD-binding oxidoreductase [Candidatus Micrarchaeota archaeon]